MEESPPPPVLAKRLWNILRIVIFMIRKGISKRKLMVDLHMMMKRGKMAGKKAFGSLMSHHHHSNFSCRTATDVHHRMSRSHPFYAPREYEFSCSNSPAFIFPSFQFHLPTRKNHQRRHHDEDDMSALRKALEMLDSETSSPVSVLPGFGFGKSPMVRQLRITDSPFPLKESGDENSHVDKEAEEFIKSFYEQLRLQKRAAMYQEMMMRAA
ncbi:hypothetical protein AAC387_Pa05g2328 [Persea americana]